MSKIRVKRKRLTRAQVMSSTFCGRTPLVYRELYQSAGACQLPGCGAPAGKPCRVTDHSYSARVGTRAVFHTTQRIEDSDD